MKHIDKTKRSISQSASTRKTSTSTNRKGHLQEMPRHTSTSSTEKLDARRVSKRLPEWVLLPLRLFLGITFVYAGVQKLTDPQFFRPSAIGYIGKQIQAFATGSPLHDFLIHFALPHATLFGILVACGEIAIGIGTLLGLLLRPAAFFGLLLSLVFFLSASWRVYPYFYGADIVFAICWITMLIAGPFGSLLPALDTLLASRLLMSAPAPWRPRLARVLYVLLGVREPSSVVLPVADQVQGKPATGEINRAPTNYRGRQVAMRHAQASRRNFLWGLLAGGGGMLAVLWLGQNLHILPWTSDDAAPAPAANPGQSGSSDDGGNQPTAVTPSSGTPGASTPIAQVNQVPPDSAVNFTIPSNSDPGVLVHLNNGRFVAFDATCTHAGCPVQYDPGSQHLLCPCHGAEFDPANGAAVVQGPTNTPLVSVPIRINNATGAISIGG